VHVLLQAGNMNVTAEEVERYKMDVVALQEIWIEDTEEDIQSMGIRGWRKLSKERTEWRRITEKAKTHSGL
jgi:glycerol-3-phosphate cytidylyltransferase-like family protein